MASRRGHSNTPVGVGYEEREREREREINWTHRHIPPP